MKYPLKQGLSWCMLSMAVSASAQVSAPVASTQLPTGGKVMSGTTSIQSVGNVLNINQSSQRSAINWNTFNVGSGAKVNFIQPSASSVTLNRVLDTNGSQILGSISANGQVFISNPNGVLFGPNSQVNVGGLIATTQNISVDDFMAGKSTFEGTGAAGSVVNQGTLEAALGGYIALLAPSVRNEGVVLAREGTVAFAAGDKTVVQFNGPQLVTVMVDRPVLDALVENKQMVRADGGLVIFSARSANAVLSSVIRNTGTVQAQTIENKNGRILLIGDMQNGSITVDGKLDASAPMQGDGGFIETSAAQVKIADSAVVTTLAKNGKTGTWLVDPHDYTVAASGGDQTGTQLSASLGTTNVTLQSASGSQTGSGNININDGVSWSANTNLTLTATNNVNVNANLSATGVTAGIAINPNTVSQSEAASGSGVFNIGSGASISLPNVLSSSTNALVISGTPYTVINSLGAQGSITGTDLQGMNGNLTKNYAIGSNIDASATSGWNSGAGFTPIAGGGTSRFSGNINGLGHSINNLYIQSPATSVIGLVGILDTNGAISNLSLAGGSVSASTNAINIGSLVGTNYGLISNSSSSTTVSSGASTQSIGGLVGGNAGTISNSFASGSVTTGTSTRAIGGLSGGSSGTIKFSYASGNVTAGSGSGGNGQAYYGGGGLVGFNSGSISDSQATGNVLLNGTGGDFGGFVGFAQGPSVITKSYATGSVTSTSSIRDIGGFVGNSNGSSIINNYSTGAVNAGAGSTWVGGFIGSNWSVSNVSNSYSTGTVICTNCTANPFAGGNIGSISNSFWNTQTSNISSNSITGGITGINSAQMKTLSTFTNVGWDSNIWLLNSSINSGFPSFTSGVLYVRFNTGTITYGSSPVLTYGIYDSYSGGNLLTNLNLAGTANLAATNNNISYSSLSNTSAAGTYTVNYLSGLSLANSLYALTPGNASNWIINKAGLTVTANSNSKVYGNSLSLNGTEFTTSGLQNGETATNANLAISGNGNLSTANVGTYSITPSLLSGGTFNSNNYTITYNPANLSVTARPINITANAATKVYGEANPSFSYATEVASANRGLITGDTFIGGLSTSATQYSPVTSYAITSTLANSNYAINYIGANLSVTARPINIAANASTKIYGEANPALSYATEVASADRGWVNNDAFSGAISSAASNTSSVGSYPITSTLANSNYTINYTGANLSVTARPINITANAATKVYGEANPNFSYNSESASTGRGLITGDTFSGSLTTAAGPSSSVGAYPISSTLANSNYAINYTGANLNVNKANATVVGLSGSTEFDGTTKTLTGFTATGLVNNETTGDIARSANNPNGISASTSGRFSGTYLNTPYGTANNYNLSFVSGQLVITGCPGGPPCTPIGPQTTASNISPVVIPAMTAPSFSSAVVSTTAPTNSAAPVLAFASSSGGGSFGSGGDLSTLANGNAPTNSSNTVNLNSSGNTNTSLNFSTTTTTIVNTGDNPATNNTTTVSANNSNNVTPQATTSASPSPTNIAGTPTTNAARPQPATGVVAINNPNATPINVTNTQPNVVNPQRLADILNKKDPVEIATALPPNQVAQLSPDQVAPLVNSLNLRQLMSLTNEQIAKFDPIRQAELLNIIKVIKDNPEKAAEKAFTPTDKTFAQLAANGLLKEQIDGLSTRVTQINQNKTNVNIDTPQKLAELLTKKDPVEIATALPSNQVAQLAPEQAAPLISSLTVRQLLALTNEQISKLDPARQTELLNIINVIKNNPEKAADKAYTAIDKTTAQYVANGLMKEQIDALASKVTQITQNKTTINLDGPQKLANILNNNTPVEVAKTLPSNLVPQLSSDQVAPLINAMSVKQLLSLTNEQMSKLDPARLTDLLNILKGLKDNPERAIDKTYTPEDTAVAKYAATGLLKDPIERLAMRANYIADNKFKDPLSKELADLTNPPVPANTPVARNTPNQANRPLTAAQLAVQNANSETPNLTPAQVAALDPKDLGPLLSKLNANQLMGITNAQMAGLDSAYLNQLTVLLNFVQDKVANPVANAGPISPGNRVNNTNIFINQPVAKLAGAALLADQPNTAPPTAPVPPPATQLASVNLTPKQVSDLDPAQLAPLINQLNANQLMAITNAQMARMDGRALNQLTILMNFVQQRAANNNGPANGNNPANGGTNTNINVFVNQPVSRLASNALLNEQLKPNAPAGAQSFTQTNITVNLTPKQVSELDPTQLAPLISKLNANQLMAITNTQMARLDTQSISQLNILMNFVQQRALNSNTNTTIYINQPVSRIAAASLMNDQPLPPQVAGAAPAPIATVPLSPQQIAGLTPSQVAPLLNRMNSRQLMAVTDTQMASLDSANLNQLITLLNFIQDNAKTSPIVTNNFATRPVASFLPPDLNTTQTVTQP